ncbi:hypothetical protein GCM10010172_21970 [Paractinoplanes ferrugineus]|uniref:Uncharacterized protein n=1 Tax=Paractinoplanes ferrugineus TaxID=113564 RepID=A0A919IVP4_9ACTN|nr:hypothetical protein Afe05nite_07320 [Actinoplanes ferrugineus]
MVAAWTPAGRLELRRSFTRLPAEYAELYFTGVPAIRPDGAGSAVVVAVTLLEHGAADRDRQVRFTLAGPSGAVLNTSTAALRVRPEVPAAVTQRLPIPGSAPNGSYLVRVALIGQPQTLHYRIDRKENTP